MNPSAAKSAKRAFEVFEMFSRNGGPLSVSEVARELDYPASSTSILMKELCRVGYLVQDPRTRHYGLAARLAMASVRLSRQSAFEQLVAEIADEVGTQTGEEVIVAVEHGIEVRYVHLRKAILPFVSRHAIGALRPICLTSMGKILLAQKEENEIGKLVRRVNTAEGPNVELPGLLEAVRAARTYRLAAAFEEATPGAAGLATLLPVRDGQPNMVLAICGEPERIRQRQSELGALLHRAVDATAGNRWALSQE